MDISQEGHAGRTIIQIEGSMLIARDVRFAKKSYKYAGAPLHGMLFPRSQNNATYIRMRQSVQDGLYINRRLPTEHLSSSYSHGKFRHLNGNIQDLFDKLLQIGVTQHYSLVEGNYIKQLVYLAKLMNFELEII